jgi:DNA-binding NtrC family response regulator
VARIVLIDDDSSIRKPLRILLESRGHEVFEAIDGALGVEMIKNDSFDLVVTDMIMPNRGGMETIMELFRLVPTLPVIAMSGKIPTEARPIRNLVNQFGVSEILQKPFTKSAFLEAINRALPGS